MNKERLEKIEKELELDWYNISNVVNQDDVKWLVNRIKGLEEERDEWKDIAQSHYMANQDLREQIKCYHKAINNIIEKAMLFGTNVDGDGENLQKVCRTMIQDYCNDENGVNKLKEENKRLRKALEFYASRNHYLVYYDKLILLDDGEKARKTLEVENNELQ